MRNEWNRGCTSHAAFHAEFIAGAAANVGASDLQIQAEILFNSFLTLRQIAGSFQSQLF